MTTPPSSPPFHVVLQALQNDFGLSKEQIVALPPLDEVDLIQQTDSHLIQHVETKLFTYHPYKLFIGQINGEPFHAYLTRNRERKQYKIELCSVDTKDETTYEPMDAGWFGTVNNLAYPYNTFLGKARFVAVVKWYFLLAFRAGEFDEDPGFAVTTTWQNDLKGACDELIAAPRREQQKEQKDKIKDLEKKAEMLRREIAKKNKEGGETVKEQATEFQQIDAMLSKPKKEDSDGLHRRTSRKSGGPIGAQQDDNKLDNNRNTESTSRRTSLPPPRLHGMNQASIFSPRVRQVPPNPYLRDPESPRNLLDHRGATPLLSEQLKERHRRPEVVFSAPFVPPPKTRRQPTPTDGQGIEKKSRFIKEGIAPTDERPTRGQKSERTTNDEKLGKMNKRLTDHGGFARTQENFEEWKQRTLNKSVEPSSERPTSRRKSEHAAKEDAEDALNGSTDGNKENQDATRMSWTQEVEQLTPTEEEEKNEDEMNKEDFEADENTQVERERRWMQLYHQRVEMLQQMRRLEDEMSVGERLDLFDKVK